MQSCDPVLARLSGVHKHHGRHPALVGVDLQVQAGRVLALLGRNGAGKSTAISLLLGLSVADAGQVQVLGGDPRERRQRLGLGVMLQSANLPAVLKVGELIEQARACYPQPRPLAEILALTGLAPLVQRRYGQLSGGQQRLLQFAIALCGRPRLLFLDEPTTGLDIQSRQALWQAIRQLVGEGCGVLLTTHYLEEAEALAQQVVVLERGRVLADTSLAQFRQQFGARRIRCRSALELEQVRRWPQVRQAQRDGDHLQLLAEPAEAVVARLLAEDPQLQELEVHAGGLADAFIELTRETA